MRCHSSAVTSVDVGITHFIINLRRPGLHATAKGTAVCQRSDARISAAACSIRSFPRSAMSDSTRIYSITPPSYVLLFVVFLLLTTCVGFQQSVMVVPTKTVVQALSCGSDTSIPKSTRSCCLPWHRRPRLRAVGATLWWLLPLSEPDIAHECRARSPWIGIRLFARQSLFPLWKNCFGVRFVTVLIAQIFAGSLGTFTCPLSLSSALFGVEHNQWLLGRRWNSLRTSPVPHQVTCLHSRPFTNFY
jgi:hypothetical protein